MKSRLVGLLVIITSLPACWGPSSPKHVDYTHHETTREDIPFARQARISSDLKSGDLTIHGWDKDLISVEKRKYAATDIELALLESEIVADETNIQIRTREKHHAAEGVIHYAVKAPHAIRLQTIHNQTGQVIIDDMSGAMDIQTASGSIRVHGARKDVALKTDSGAIQLSYAEHAAGNAKIDTRSGDVQIMHAAGNTHVNTESGSITITQLSTAQGKTYLETNSGRIRVSNLVANTKIESISGSLLIELGDIRPNTVITLNTKTGRVTVVVPRTINIALDAHTESGSIRSDYSLQHEDTHLFGVIGTERDIPNRLIIHTVSGNIAIQKK